MSAIGSVVPLSPQGVAPPPPQAAPLPQQQQTVPVTPRPAFVISIASLAASTALSAFRAGAGQSTNGRNRIGASRPAGLRQAGGVAPTVSADAIEQADAVDQAGDVAAPTLRAADAVKQGSVAAGAPTANRVDLSA